MATNNQKFNNFMIVLNAPKEKASNDQAETFFNGAISQLLSYNKIKFLASIIHDRDITENGEPKTIHSHIVIETTEKTTQLGQLKAISEYLGISKDLISIEGSNNEFLSVQYLTHKNQAQKTSYDFEKIITNNKELLEQRYNEEYVDPMQELMRDLTECKSLTELMQRQGPEKANKYRQMFKDLKLEQGQDIARISKKLEDLMDFINDLFNDLNEHFDRDTLQRLERHYFYQFLSD